MMSWKVMAAAPLVWLLPVPGYGDGPARPAAPSITSITPNMAVAGTTIVRMQVNGSGFDSASRVMWNGRALTTTYYRSTLLGAVVPASDLAAPRNATVTVVDAGGDSTWSNTVTFTVGNPVPTFIYKSHSQAPLFGEPFAMRVHGRSFVPGAAIRWNGTALPTVRVDSTHLTTTVPASLLTAAGTAQVTVFNPPPMGGVSAASALSVDFMTPALRTNLPAAMQLTTTSTDLPIRITGTDFIRSGSPVVRFNGVDRPTTWVSQTELHSSIAAAALGQVGYSDVTVRVTLPGLGSRESAPRRFQVSSPKPFVGSTRPAPLIRLHTTRVTLTGLNFLPQITVGRNGSPRVVRFVQPTEIQVTLDPSDVVQTGTVTFDLVNPAPTISPATASLTVVNPVPVASAIAPQNVLVGGRAFMLTLTGSGFVPGTVVRVNGAARLTTYVSRNELRAGIPASDLTAGGALSITATTPSPGGGSTAALKLNRYRPTLKLP